MIRLGILGSRTGSYLPVIIDAILQRQLAAEIKVVISNKLDAGILDKARAHGLDTFVCESKGQERAAFDATVSQCLVDHEVELVVLMGYMRILTPAFVATWRNRILNVHPSLLPDFAGMMDLDVHQSVLAAGRSETGCTVHYVTEVVDAGPVVVQSKCPVLPNDTAEILKARVQALEAPALIEAIAKVGATPLR